MNRKLKHVALMIPSGWETAEPIRRGVMAFVRARGSWDVATLPEWQRAGVRDLARWQGDGAIVEARSPDEIAFAAKLAFPVVNMLSHLPPGDLPQAMTDNEAVGRLGAAHLLERGFTQCVFYGMLKQHYAARRLEGFRQGLLERHVACTVFSTPGLLSGWQSWDRHRDRLEAFLRGLSPPFAVMASDDARARLVIESCARAGLAVPGDVAVLGVDNMPLMCESCRPPLSSVDRDLEQLGFEMARLLDDLMRHGRVPDPIRLVPPKGVVARASTDVYAIANTEVRAAVDYMRANLHRPFGVEAIISKATVSRRWLEQLFREALGMSIHQYLCRLRVERAKGLLAETPGLKLEDVAVRCGFAGTRRFRLVFLRQTGMSPRAYRNRQKRSGHGSSPR